MNIVIQEKNMVNTIVFKHGRSVIIGLIKCVRLKTIAFLAMSYGKMISSFVPR